MVATATINARGCRHLMMSSQRKGGLVREGNVSTLLVYWECGLNEHGLISWIWTKNVGAGKCYVGKVGR